MDFEPDETQQIIASSAADVLASPAGAQAPWQAGRAADASYDVAAWRRLAKAGLLAPTLLPRVPR